jgi:DNA polymerase III subunit beta
MRLTVDRQAFSAALGQAAKYVETRTESPVLSTVLLRTGDGDIEIAATDHNRLFGATIEARVEIEGAIAAKADLLAGFVRGAVGRNVELALVKSLLEVRSARARGRIPTLAADEFPEAFRYRAANVGFEIDGAVLATCLNSVRYAISKEEARYYLTGTSWSIRDHRLELAATDGRILSMISIETPVGAEGLQPVIVPNFAIPAFSGPVRIELADTFIRFSGVVGNRMAITSKLIEGPYPDYRKIIRPATLSATVARKALAEAVGRCIPLCQVNRAPVDLIHDIEGELVVRVLAPDGAEIEDRIEIEGSQFALSLGGSLLAATLASFNGDTIEIGLSGIGDHIRFGEPGNGHRLAIVMPRRGNVMHRIGPPRRNAAQ